MSCRALRRWPVTAVGCVRWYRLLLMESRTALTARHGRWLQALVPTIHRHSIFSLRCTQCGPLVGQPPLGMLPEGECGTGTPSLCYAPDLDTPSLCYAPDLDPCYARTCTVLDIVYIVRCTDSFIRNCLAQVPSKSLSTLYFAW
jgi:hypothetical protein